MATYPEFTPSLDEWKGLGVEIASVLDRYAAMSEDERIERYEEQPDETLNWLLNTLMIAFSVRPAYLMEGYETHADLSVKEYPLIHKYILGQIAQQTLTFPDVPPKQSPDVIYYHALQPNPIPEGKFTTTSELGRILGYPCPRDFGEPLPKAVSVEIKYTYKTLDEQMYAYICEFDDLITKPVATIDDTRVTKYNAIIAALGLADALEITTRLQIYDQSRVVAKHEAEEAEEET